MLTLYFGWSTVTGEYRPSLIHSCVILNTMNTFWNKHLTLWRPQFFYKSRRPSTYSRSSSISSFRSTLSTTQTGTTNFRRASGSCPTFPLHISLLMYQPKCYLLSMSIFRVLAVKTSFLVTIWVWHETISMTM